MRIFGPALCFLRLQVRATSRWKSRSCDLCGSAKEQGESRRSDGFVAVDGRVTTRIATVKYDDGTEHKVRQPLLELFQPRSEREVESGTSLGGAASCPVTNFTTPVESVRAQLTVRRGGASDARLICVVSSHAGSPGRFYRMADRHDEVAAMAAAAELRHRQEVWSGELPLIPDGELNHLRGFFNIVLYGMTRWGDMFSPRQALALTTFVHAVAEDSEDSYEPVAISNSPPRCRHASLSSWIGRRRNCHPSADGTHLAKTHKAPLGVRLFRWCGTSAEVNPFSGSGGDWDTALDWVVRVLETTAVATEGATEPVTLNVLQPHPTHCRMIVPKPWSLTRRTTRRFRTRIYQTSSTRGSDAAGRQHHDLLVPTSRAERRGDRIAVTSRRDVPEKKQRLV